MYDYDTNEGHMGRNIALVAVFGLAAYGVYRLFSNPDMVRRFGPVGDKVADGIEQVKDKAGDLAGNVRQKAGEYVGRAKEMANQYGKDAKDKYQQWREQPANENAPVGGGSQI